MSAKTKISLEEYLALPESKPYLEYMDGEVVEKAMPNESHSDLVARLITLLGIYLMNNPGFRIGTEFRHIDPDNEWVFLPDVSLTRSSRCKGPSSGARGPSNVVPDFAVEVLSPDDRAGDVQRKIAYYMRAGVELLWVIDPDAEDITVWKRGEETRRYGNQGVLSADPIVPGFSVDLAALFAILHEE